MAKRFFKHKLLLDEHLDDRRAYPMLNERFDVKHIAADLRAGTRGQSLAVTKAVPRPPLEAALLLLPRRVKSLF